MKTPLELIWYPLDRKKIKEYDGLWFYLPNWICRAYRLKEYKINMGQIKFVIKKDKRARIEYSGEENCADEYFKRNWSKKIRLKVRK